jgi:predicted transcriptional regulator
MTVLQLRLDREIARRLERIAQQECRTTAGQVYYIVRRWLEQQSDPPAERQEARDAARS